MVSGSEILANRSLLARHEIPLWKPSGYRLKTSVNAQQQQQQCVRDRAASASSCIRNFVGQQFHCPPKHALAVTVLLVVTFCRQCAPLKSQEGYNHSCSRVK